MNQQTEQAHQDLKKVLLNGRILLNGMPLTAQEISLIIRGEQMLYEKATQLDSERVAKKAEKNLSEDKKPNRGVSITSPFHSNNLKEKEKKE
ncbi:MAG: hypothetical protein KAV87_38560 [Desulfobacteraceae bacterium]|nr:hypothetical protein [Desulfobacteraceae bacterium]